MDKGDVCVCIYIYIHTHIYNGILAVRGNKTESFIEMWMDLETVIQSKVNQNEKNKYCIYAESRKMV